jgi:hypothetical protein
VQLEMKIWERCSVARLMAYMRSIFTQYNFHVSRGYHIDSNFKSEKTIRSYKKMKTFQQISRTLTTLLYKRTSYDYILANQWWIGCWQTIIWLKES